MQLITVALYHRDHLSRGSSRRTFGYEAYHWGIILTPQTSRGRDCWTYAATDKCYLDTVTMRMVNPTMDWWLDHRDNVDPPLSGKLLGRIIIGQVPDGITFAEVDEFLQSVPLPVKNKDPQQSCVTWVSDAIQRLQGRGWVRVFELANFKDFALSAADQWINELESTEPRVVEYKV